MLIGGLCCFFDRRSIPFASTSVNTCVSLVVNGTRPKEASKRSSVSLAREHAGLASVRRTRRKPGDPRTGGKCDMSLHPGVVVSVRCVSVHMKLQVPGVPPFARTSLSTNLWCLPEFERDVSARPRHIKQKYFQPNRRSCPTPTPTKQDWRKYNPPHLS